MVPFVIRTPAVEDDDESCNRLFFNFFFFERANSCSTEIQQDTVECREEAGIVSIEEAAAAAAAAVESAT